MVGITSVGAHIPIYRLNRDEIARMWSGRSTGGARAVAGYDEDTVTMAVAATLDCLARSGAGINGLSLATTTTISCDPFPLPPIRIAPPPPPKLHSTPFPITIRPQAQ